jgi:hypothetical protein
MFSHCFIGTDGRTDRVTFIAISAGFDNVPALAHLYPCVISYCSPQVLFHIGVLQRRDI